MFFTVFPCYHPYNTVRRKPVCFPSLLPPFSTATLLTLAAVVPDTTPIYTGRLYQRCAASSCRTPVTPNYFSFLALLKSRPPTARTTAASSPACLASDSLFAFSPFSSVRGDQNTVQMLHCIPLDYHIKTKF